jgi:hypothetical protein
VKVGDSLSDQLLEVQRTLLHFRMHLPIHEHAIIEVLLRGGTESLVFCHNSFVHGVDELELFFSNVLVAVDLVADRCLAWSYRDKALHEEELGPDGCVS